MRITNQFPKWSLTLLITLLVTTGLPQDAKTETLVAESDEAVQTQVKVEIWTSLGTMTAVLYNETPLHRDNFIKLCKEDYYDSLLWHRVIGSFMIQGGDPDSKDAKPTDMLGNGGPGYTVPAEIIDGIFHKKGVLAAARNGDNVNPERASSGSQFYIAQGKKYTDQSLAGMERKMVTQRKNISIRDYLRQPENKAVMNAVTWCQQERNSDSLQKIMQAIEPFATEHLTLKGFSDAQKKAYTEVGGIPHLDGAYTVFGEIIDGFDVLDKIGAVPCGANNRPLEDIKMSVRIIE